MNAGTMVVVNLNMKREAGRIPGLNGVFRLLTSSVNVLSLVTKTTLFI